MNGPVSDHDRVRGVFQRALDLPRARREDFVRAALDDRSDLAALALELLDGAPEAVDGRVEPLLALDRLGDYEILGLVGRGGMAVVLHAVHVATGREVALKILPMGTASRALRERLARESEVLRSLDHPGIARWRDGGVVDTPEGPRPFIAMDHFDGVPLLEWVERERPDAARRLAVLESVTRAVAHGHARGIVHRDLKPSNVLVGRHDRTCILDYGVAKVLGEDTRDGDTMTAAGELVGTLRFMSPEQAEGRRDDVGPATDVHALGLMIHEVMTGVPPYVVPTRVSDALPAIIHARPEPPAVDDPQLRQGLERIGEATLARDPRARLADAEILANDLATLRDGGAVPRRRPGRTLRWRWALGPAVLVLAALVWVGFRGELREGGDAIDRTVVEQPDTVRPLAGLEAELADVERAREEALAAGDPAWPLGWRRATLLHVLGRRQGDPARLEQARAAWTELTAPESPQAASARLALAGVHLDLARHETPVRHAARAREEARTVLQAVAPDGAPVFGDVLQGRARCALGEALVVEATLTGDPVALDDAIDLLVAVEDHEMIEALPDERARLRYLLGRAYAARAELTDRVGDVDRAEFWVRRSFEDRPSSRVAEHVRSQIAFVHVARLRVGAASTADSIATALEVTGDLADAVLTALRESVDAHDRGRVAVEVASAAIDAALRGVEDAMDVAATWSVQVDEGFDRARDPLGAARWDLERARNERACVSWCDEPLEDHVDRARAALDAAAAVFDPEDAPRLHARIADEREWWAARAALTRD